ncbi:MAG: hypothetical protein JEZ11_12610 [Desulfobacterales bacterium]|nr:hypothetical protein [Desulfobacterales bacterium]
MIAYFVHDSRKEIDFIILPDAGLSVTVSADKLDQFIAPQPNFSQWEGIACPNLDPNRFGKVIATRDDQGDICVLDATLWEQRMRRHLG